MERSNPSWLGPASQRVPYIVAEVGVNHDGHIEKAVELVEIACKAGADCVKFQAFSADELAIRSAQKAAYQENCGTSGESQYDMLCRYELAENDFVELNRCCKALAIDFMVTPFSQSWVGFLQELGVNTIKIGSGNIGSPLLLKSIGRTGLPVILSSGMSHLDELQRAVDVLYDNGTQDLAILHCVSLYPTRIELANLRAMQTIVDTFDVTVGFSDHTEEVFSGALAVASGARILEKHLTLNKNAEGPDHAMSLSPDELTEYVYLARQAALAMGDGRKQALAEEMPVKEAVQMSVVATQPIPAGCIIKETKLDEKRPATGILAENMSNVIGQIAKVDIAPNQILTWDLLKAGRRETAHSECR